MSYGLTIKNDEGKTFISPNVTPMNFIKKMDVWIPKNSDSPKKIHLNTEIADNCIVLPFIRAIGTDWSPSMLSRIYSENGVKVIEIIQDEYVNYTLEVYLFANFVPKLTNYGLEIYNDSHQIIYNNTCNPLEINFIKKPNHSLFGKEGGGKKRNSIMIDIGHPVAALCTSYGLKSFPAGGQNGHIEYNIFSIAIENSVGLHLIRGRDGKYVYNYPNIGDIPYIDVRKYK